MPKASNPRYGSMQFWPRKRAKRIFPRVRYTPPSKESKLLGFIGYKAGMTHIEFVDNKKTSKLKNQELVTPVTIVECPPLKVFSLVLYQKNNLGYRCVKHILAESFDKELARKIVLPKKQQAKDIPAFDKVTLLCYTQPGLTAIGKKKPELFEVALGGSKDEQLSFAQQKLGKEIPIEEIFKEGEQVDIHAVTKGKGYQGPVKRFGVSLRSHKSEKTKRGPGNLSGWQGQGHTQYRVAHAGQMGFQTRTEYNKWIMKIGKNPDDLKVKGGIIRYGFLKNPYILLKGSIPGPKKRPIRLVPSIRSNHKIPNTPPQITYISLTSQQ